MITFEKAKEWMMREGCWESFEKTLRHTSETSPMELFTRNPNEDFIISAFPWEDTSEGLEYWANLFIKFSKWIRGVPEDETYVLIDIDGTVAEYDAGLYEPNGEFDEDAFRANLSKAKPIEDVILVIQSLVRSTNSTPMFITGRNNSMRDGTIAWLEKHLPFVCNPLVVMRPNGDHRPDYEVKRELLESVCELFPDLSTENTIIFDDRASVCEMWRELGFRVMQVAKGDY